MEQQTSVYMWMWVHHSVKECVSREWSSNLVQTYCLACLCSSANPPVQPALYFLYFLLKTLVLHLIMGGKKTDFYSTEMHLQICTIFIEYDVEKLGICPLRKWLFLTFCFLTTSSILLCLRCSGGREGGCALRAFLPWQESARQQPAYSACKGGASGRGGEAQVLSGSGRWCFRCRGSTLSFWTCSYQTRASHYHGKSETVECFCYVSEYWRWTFLLIICLVPMDPAVCSCWGLE